MTEEAYCGPLSPSLHKLGQFLDQLQQHPPADAGQRRAQWQTALQQPLPLTGSGAAEVLTQLGEQVIPNGVPIAQPGFTSFITTGPVNVGVLAATAAMLASPQRIGLSAFQQLEELSLNWLVQLFGLPAHMQGLYCSGGSTANLLALGAARQWAFERRGHDCGRDGVPAGGRIFATAASHRTIHRAAAVLGLGRNAVITVAMDAQGRMLAEDLEIQLQNTLSAGLVPVAIVANAGSTGTGSIDPLAALAGIAQRHQVWLHVDGAYGLPGILDERVRPLYDGINYADSVVVDPHKWLGAPVGIGAALVRDRSLLQRAFTQGPSDYLEGSFNTGLEDATEPATEFVPVLASMGIPYSDFGVELSAPCRGVVVWALLQEIGAEGMTARVCRHNDMARALAEQVLAHPRLELLQEPTLSICCFRYRPDADLIENEMNAFNRRLHRQLILRGRAMPSTVQVNGQLALRPCFIGARTGWDQVDELLQEVLTVGNELSAQLTARQNAV